MSKKNKKNKNPHNPSRPEAFHPPVVTAAETDSGSAHSDSDSSGPEIVLHPAPPSETGVAPVIEVGVTAPSLDRVEDDAGWFVFALAVMTVTPPPMFHAGAAAAAVFGVKVWVTLSRVRRPEAAEDVQSARMFLMVLTMLAASYRVAPSTMSSILGMFLCMLFFNVLHNVTVVGKPKSLPSGRKAATASK